MNNVLLVSDRVSIVRCRECRHRGDRYNCPVSYLLHSAGMDILDGHTINTPEFYCAYGDTREGNSNGESRHTAGDNEESNLAHW